MNSPWNEPSLHSAFVKEFRALVKFASRCECPNGFAALDSEGGYDLDAPVELWITCRMTYVFALAQMCGIAGADELVEHGLNALAGPFYDVDNGGWYSALSDSSPEAGPSEGARKEAYAHAFVILATAAASLAGHDRAAELLDLALKDQDLHWWEPSFGRVRNSWDCDWTNCEDYRGLNANMHTVEAYLAAWDATGERIWLDRAREIMRFVCDLAARHGSRLPEHFDADWTVRPDMFADDPVDPFRPYGVTPGHGFEWARLILHGRAALEAIGDTPGPWMLETARALVDRADEDGWDREGVGGFVYTTDFDGRPVVETRMHWVACEAVNAALALGKTEEGIGDVKGAEIQGERFARYAAWTDEYLHEAPGRWFHELDTDGRPGSRVWPGKPDAYHVAQMLLLPLINLAPGFAAALAKG